jgi:hypothetical protein
MDCSARPNASLLIRLAPVAAIVALIAVVLVGSEALLRPLVLLAVLLAPALLPRRILYPPVSGPPEDADTDGGGGPPQPEPPKPPQPPWGGVPLPDAQPARVRRRDHGRSVLTARRPRRAAQEPERVRERHPAYRPVRR